MNNVNMNVYEIFTRKKCKTLSKLKKVNKKCNERDTS